MKCGCPEIWMCVPLTFSYPNAFLGSRSLEYEGMRDSISVLICPEPIHGCMYCDRKHCIHCTINHTFLN